MQFGSISITVHSSSEGGAGAWIQRLLHITNSAGNGSTTATRALIHLQFLGWPPGGMPPGPSSLLQLCGEALSLQAQQRVKQRPVLLTCVTGTGRSSVATLLVMFLGRLQSAGTLCDLQTMCVDLCCARRGGLQDKEYLCFLYSAALYAAQDVLMKRGILTNKATFEDGPREKSRHVRHPSADLLAPNCDFNRLKFKLGLDSEESSEALQESFPVNEKDPSITPDGRNESSDPKGSNYLSGMSLPASLAASLDPQQLKIEHVAPGKGVKITKESFDKSMGGLESSRSKDPDDPFSSLDPLWSINKSS